jgi:hypothetical protein
MKFKNGVSVNDANLHAFQLLLAIRPILSYHMRVAEIKKYAEHQQHRVYAVSQSIVAGIDTQKQT